MSKKPIPFLLYLLLLAPLPAFANHGLQGLGVIIEIAAVLLALVLLNLGLSVYNVYHKSKKLRVMNIIGSLPLILLCLLLSLLPAGIAVWGLPVIALQVFLIVKSYRRNPEAEKQPL